VLSGRGLCDELITRPEESYRLCCVVVCDVETSRIGAPYIYDISSLRIKSHCFLKKWQEDRLGDYFSAFVSISHFSTNSASNVYRISVCVHKHVFPYRPYLQKIILQK